MKHNSYPEHSIEEFASSYGIDIAADKGQNTHLVPQLAEHDDRGTTSQHVIERGADYYFSRLNYLEGSRIHASRMIAKILAGQRTELAYWAQAAPAKQLTVHRGKGNMVVGYPEDNSMHTIPLDSETKQDVTLLPGVIYTFEAAPDTTEALVISGFYEPPVESWGDLEKVVNPGDHSVVAPEGVITIPEEFRQRYS